MDIKLVVINTWSFEVTIDLYDVENMECVDEEYIRKLGFDPDYCHWFFASKLSIMSHSNKETNETT